MNRPTPHSAPSVPSLDVTAVVVTRGTTPFLPTTLAAVGASTLAPSRVVVVDVTPREKDRAQVPEQLGPDVAVTTLHAPDAHTFGEAVNAAIAHLTGEQVPDTGRRSQRARPAEPAAAPELERDGWLWLLHDDSPPEPGALEALVRVVENKPSVVVAGAKQRDLDDPSRLLEVGLTTSPTGVRMTGIEEGEVDQGQHDGAEDVLAVGLAGALFRLDAWRALGGTDPAYGKYGDGLEICRRARLAGHRVIVVPQAAVRHARASLTDRRDRDPDHVPEPERTVGARRRSALHYRLAGASPAAVPLHMLAILLAAPFLAMAQLAAKRPRRARAEITAAIGAVLRPVALARSRRRARRTAALPRRAITPLRATWREVAAERRDRRLSQAARRRAALAADPFARAERRRDRARRTAGLVGTVLLLTAVTVWWLGDAIGPLADGGRLVSANLLPAGVSLQELWNDVADGWLRAGTGAPGASDPLMTTLLPATALAHLLGGDLQVVVNLLLLLAPVLAGTGAWFAAGTATKSLVLRTVAALVWVAAPSLAVSLVDGRVGAVLAHVALPWLAWGALKGVGLGARAPLAPAAAGPDAVLSPAGSLPAAALGGLAAAAAVGGAPHLTAPILASLLVLAVLLPRHRGRRGYRRNLALVAAPVLLVLAPLVAELLRSGPGAHWRVLLTDPGVAVPHATAPAWQQLLGWPVPAEEWFPRWTGVAWLDAALPFTVGALVVLAAVSALTRPGLRARAVRGAWLVAALALAAAAAAALLVVGQGAEGGVRTWTGGAVSLVLLALGGAALVGLDGVTARAAQHSFGWRQLSLGLGVAAILAAAGATIAHAGLSTDLTASSGHGLRVLQRDVVPAVGRQMQEEPRAGRVLVLDAGDEITYQLLRGNGPLLTESSVVLTERGLHTDDAAGPLGGAVAALVGVSGEESEQLADLGVAAVVVSPAGTPAQREELVANLGTSAALEQVAEGEYGTIWRVVSGLPSAEGTPAVVSWARVVDERGAALVVPSDGTSLDVALSSLDQPAAAGTWTAPPGRRLLVLAETADPGWRATLDGRELTAVEGERWEQAFELPADATGRVVVQFESVGSGWWRATIVGFAVVYVLLLIPVRRKVTTR
ncbi:GT2 family glycosyltransferase [Flavimobilis soli]|uniref:GT2 family glycosyltransferase n=1 Tax=Flavimobilis soli TaxID=442709 RepID=A0A2A9EF96_9MICO|nr:glycosyltransferase [Flavimobilis soli]PFG37594.1 GT2 family glycosyltransferase [Flavimobilis soli]